ncbi:MAG TPA: ABC transporter permease [Thermoanaerobaculia bacterium]|jgi:lipopolysaccharide transport system permease protein
MTTTQFSLGAEEASEVIELLPKPSAALRLAEIWHYRELLYFLIWRDIRVKYKQTALGILWALLQPVALMAIFSLFLGRYAQVPSGGTPYPIMVLAGLLPWQLFSQALSESSNSVVASERLITKVYFPRVIIPAAAVGSAIPDFCIGFFVLIGLLPYYGIPITVRLLIAPLFVALALLVAFAVGLWLSALNVQYRDVRHAIGFLIQAWMFVTPVVYPLSVVPHKWRHLYALNPMVGVIEGFRRSVVEQQPFPGRIILVSVFATVVVLAGGLFYFRRMEQTFADII